MRANRQMVPMMAILAAGILGAGVALAELPEGQGAAGPEGMHGFGRLHKQLNLNAQLEALWQKAQAAQRDAIKALRAKGEETRTKLRAEIGRRLEGERGGIGIFRVPAALACRLEDRRCRRRTRRARSPLRSSIRRSAPDPPCG